MRRRSAKFRVLRPWAGPAAITRTQKRIQLLCIGAALTGFATRGTIAANDDFYRDKTLTIVVGAAAGGAYDAYGRLLARHIGHHIPGNPAVLVQNMPGAGGLPALRYLETNAPLDGTVIASFNAGLITQSIVSPDTVSLRFSDLYWIGGITHEFRICYAWHTTGLKNWNDLVAADHFIMGGVAVGTAEYMNGSLLRNIFGLKIKQIGGYAGSAQERLAIERGELDGACSEWNALPDDWIRDRKVYPLVRWLKQVPADFHADVPYVVDLAASMDDKSTLSSLTRPSELGNPFAASRKAPPQRLEILRRAFAATMKDKSFLDDAFSQKMPVEPTDGLEAQSVVASIYQEATTEHVEKARNAMR